MSAESNIDREFTRVAVLRKRATDLLNVIFHEDVVPSQDLRSRGIKYEMKDYNIILFSRVSGLVLQINHGSRGELFSVLSTISSDQTNERAIGSVEFDELDSLKSSIYRIIVATFGP